jgi:hypothetical protein
MYGELKRYIKEIGPEELERYECHFNFTMEEY